MVNPLSEEERKQLQLRKMDISIMQSYDFTLVFKYNGRKRELCCDIALLSYVISSQALSSSKIAA